MATEAQIKANRQNAKKSTGPRTAGGKRAASKNAVTHGLFGREVTIHGESEEQYDRHREAFLDELRPVGMSESVLAERIITLSWRLRRAERMENQATDMLIIRCGGEVPDTAMVLAIPHEIRRIMIDAETLGRDLSLGQAVIRDFSYFRVIEKVTLYARRVENNLIKTMKELKALDLQHNQITDISRVSEIPSLIVLELGNNQIAEISGLSGLPNLRTLSLQSNQIEVVPVLSDLPALRSLDLEDNQITDVNALPSLPGLRALNLQDNEIADVWPLTELGQLTHLDLSRNPIDEHTYSNVLPVIQANNPDIDLVYDPSPWAFVPRPYDRAVDVTHDPLLTWTSGAYSAEHDVYFGADQEAVINADPNDPNVYQGRLALDVTSYGPGDLEWNATYYWRVDQVNEPESWSPIAGSVWSFTTAGFLVVDDFELYNDDIDANQAVFQKWLDGFGFGSPEKPPYFAGNGTGSAVGYWNPPYTEQTIVHGGRQSMPLQYDNGNEPRYSQAGRTWAKPADWTVNGMDTLQIFVRGESTNGPDALYITLEDDGGNIATVAHSDPDAVLATAWLEWNIPLADLGAAGIDVTAIRKMDIGIGSPDNPQPGGVGILYVDGIRVIKLTP